jgi:hypothetical protein
MPNEPTAPPPFGPHGNYAYRFSGFSMRSDEGFPYYIVGLGILSLDGAGNITGSLTSSITRLSDSDASLIHGKYAVTGSYTFAADSTGSATLTLSSPDQTMVGTFDLVAASADRIFLISTGATLSPPSGVTPDEVVSGEAIRIA